MRRFRALTNVLVLLQDQHLVAKPNSHFHFQALSFTSKPPHDDSSLPIVTPNLMTQFGNLSDNDHGCDGSDLEHDQSTLTPQEQEHDSEEANALVAMLLMEQPRLEMKRRLDEFETVATPGLVSNVLSRVRGDWEAAFTFFLWAGKRPNYSHSAQEYHSMISILAKHRRFDTAWSLVEEMRSLSLVVSHTLMIMIRRYSAIQDVGRAINAFYAHKRFGLPLEMREFQGLLSALCRYKNAKNAEHFLMCNGKEFPFNTKSFNIVLSGWCSMAHNPARAQRVWREMSRRGVKHDVVSYACLMSCHAKAGNVCEVLKIFEEMKVRRIVPDLKVYNSVISALSFGKFHVKAAEVLKTMESEGVPPDASTYNSLIKPLCASRRVDDAWGAYDKMLKRGISPTAQTFRAFLTAVRSSEEVFTLLDKMRHAGFDLDVNTLVTLIRKLSDWRKVEDVLKLWEWASERGVKPDRRSYIALIHGLFLNDELALANKYYSEMKEKEFSLEPKTDEALRAWLSGKRVAGDSKRETSYN